MLAFDMQLYFFFTSLFSFSFVFKEQTLTHPNVIGCNFY